MAERRQVATSGGRRWDVAAFRELQELGVMKLGVF